MSDRYFGKIQIWGNLKEKDLQTFLDAVDNDCPDKEYDTYEEHARKYSGDTLEFEDPEARYGQFEEIEDTCRALGLNFTRHSGAYYEYAACNEWCVDGKNGSEALDNDGNPKLTANEIISYCEAHREFKEEDAPKLLNEGRGWKRYLAKSYLETGKVPTIEDYARQMMDATPSPGIFKIIP